MNYLIIAGIIGFIYYLSKRQQSAETIIPIEEGRFPTAGYRELIDFSTSTPVPRSTEAIFIGEMKYMFNINVEWKNLDSTWDLIVFMIGGRVIATIHPRVTSGRQTISVEVDAVPGGQRQLAAIVKNVEGVEHVKAAAYSMISFGSVV